MTSPLRGAEGNAEFLFHLRQAGSVDAGTVVDDAQLDACVDASLARPGARR
jgi:hypothetical protein